MRCGFWSGPARGSSAFRPLAAVLALVGFGFVYEREANRLAADYEAGTEPDRRNAIRALRGLDGAAVRALLLEAMEDEDSEVRFLAVRALVEREVSDVIPLVTPWLDERAEEPRCVAVETLAHFHVVSERARIERMLADPDASVRQRVARALGAMGGSVAALAGALGDADSRVKLAALEALQASGASVAHAEPAASTSTSEDALALANASTAVADAAHDADPLVRRAALVALLAIARESAASSALAALDDTDADVLVAALGALGTLHEPAFVARVVPFLDHAEDDVALAAVYALGRFAPAAVARPLAARLGDPRLGAAAGRVLAHLGRAEGSGAREALVACIDALAPETSRANVRTAAFAALVDCVGVAPRTLPAETERLLVALVARDHSPHSVALLVASPDDDASRVLTELAVGTADHAADHADASRASRASRAALDALAMHLDAFGPDGRVAEPVLASLDAMDPDARLLALRVLGASGAERIRGALRERLTHLSIESKDERAALIEALGALADEASLSLFAAAATEPSPALERASADALAALGERAFERVARLAAHRSGWARSVAIDVTGRWLADPAFRDNAAHAAWLRRVEHAMRDRNPRVVSAAIDAATNVLADRNGGAGAEPLMAALTRLAADTRAHARLSAEALAFVASPVEPCAQRPANRTYVAAEPSSGLPAYARIRIVLPGGRSFVVTSDARGRLPRRFTCAERLELVDRPRAPSRRSVEGASP